ncbi:MAG: sigma 54-interacting transcriptional regulator, partial [Bacillota bacterium]|nr:sigma 54-interacting transcriptional regulator [Bacillota bacterium]
RSRVPANSAFEKTIKNRKPYIVSEPRIDQVCKHCELIDTCEEEAEVCCPILVDDEIVGVIGIITFNQSRKEKFLAKRDSYLNFIEKMANLISIKLSEKKAFDSLAFTSKMLEMTFEMVELGIVSLDQNYEIILCNEKAKTVLSMHDWETGHLNFEEAFPAFKLKEVFKSGQGYEGKNIKFVKDHDRFDLYVSVFPVLVDGDCKSLLLILQDGTDFKRSVQKAFKKDQSNILKDMLGRDDAYLEVLESALEAAKTDSTILITGESGTGKELLARTIHEKSGRSGNLYLTVNCSAIPEALLESELFGYDDGAFTGARKGGKSGLFELATGGTIFLDEIADMSLYHQAKLLRVIQDRVIYRVGGTDRNELDVRLICATNKNLKSLVQNGQFREDLYFRINVVPLQLPPLRERKSDIQYIAEFFLKKYNSKFDKEISGFADDVIELFNSYSWPGNIRELENIIEYAVNFEKSRLVRMETVKKRIDYRGDHSQGTLKEILEAYEKKVIENQIKLYGNTLEGKLKAAKKLGISKSTLYRKLTSDN